MSIRRNYFNPLGKVLFFISILTTLVSCGPNVIEVVIQPVGNEMKYATEEFSVKPGQKVKLIMDNLATVPFMKHNVVILLDASKMENIASQAISKQGEVTQSSAILAATAIAAPGQKTEIEFIAPTQEGEYIYFCSYPGHYMMMQGKMIVKK